MFRLHFYSTFCVNMSVGRLGGVAEWWRCHGYRSFAMVTVPLPWLLFRCYGDVCNDATWLSFVKYISSKHVCFKEVLMIYTTLLHKCFLL